MPTFLANPQKCSNESYYSNIHYSDILAELDNNNGTILTLIDLSSDQPQTTASANNWLKSFITKRTSYDVRRKSYINHYIHTYTTRSHMITNGVIQWSVLWILLFNI